MRSATRAGAQARRPGSIVAQATDFSTKTDQSLWKDFDAVFEAAPEPTVDDAALDEMSMALDDDGATAPVVGTEDGMLSFEGTAGGMLDAMKAAGIQVPDAEQAAKKVANAPPAVMEPAACGDPSCTHDHDHSHSHDHGHGHGHEQSKKPQTERERRAAKKAAAAKEAEAMELERMKAEVQHLRLMLLSQSMGVGGGGTDANAPPAPPAELPKVPPHPFDHDHDHGHNHAMGASEADRSAYGTPYASSTEQIEAAAAAAEVANTVANKGIRQRGLGSKVKEGPSSTSLPVKMVAAMGAATCGPWRKSLKVEIGKGVDSAGEGRASGQGEGISEPHCWLSEARAGWCERHGWGDLVSEGILPCWVCASAVAALERADCDQAAAAALVEAVVANNSEHAAFVWAEEFATSHPDPNPDPTTDGGDDGGASAPPLVSEPPIEVEGVQYAGAEQYFQLQKSKTTPEYRQAAAALANATAEEALAVSRTFAVRDGWGDMKLEVMRRAVRAKVLQSPALRELLLSTEGYPLVCFKQTDAFWGTGKKGTGKNHLGKLLTDVRAELLAAREVAAGARAAGEDGPVFAARYATNTEVGAVDVSGGGGGVLKMKMVVGDGAGLGGDAVSKGGCGATVHYTGRLDGPQGPVFDCSRTKGRPFSFLLGTGAVIEGWDRGVATMEAGERAILTIKGDYGYGVRGHPPKIPPSATLCFDVEVVSFTRAGAEQLGQGQGQEGAACCGGGGGGGHDHAHEHEHGHGNGCC